MGGVGLAAVAVVVVGGEREHVRVRVRVLVRVRACVRVVCVVCVVAVVRLHRTSSVRLPSCSHTLAHACHAHAAAQRRRSTVFALALRVLRHFCLCLILAIWRVAAGANR